MLIRLFTVTWEKRKLGSIAKTTIGKFVIKTKQNDDSIYPVYNGGISYTGKYDEYNNQGPKIVVSARGANAGFVNLVTTNYWAGNSCYSIEIIDKSIFSLDYIYSFMKYNQWRFTAYQQAANIPSVSKADMEKFNINFPEFNEQEKIGILFQMLDQLITVNQDQPLTLTMFSICTFTL